MTRWRDKKKKSTKHRICYTIKGEMNIKKKRGTKREAGNDNSGEKGR